MAKYQRGDHEISPDPEIVFAAVSFACEHVQRNGFPRITVDMIFAPSQKGSSKWSAQARQVYAARAYAALALRCLFDECKYKTIGNLVNAHEPQSFVSLIDYRLKNNMLDWWKNEAFIKVVEATEETIKQRMAQLLPTGANG